MYLIYALVCANVVSPGGETLEDGVKYLIGFVCLAVLSGCAPIRFTCGVGEFGPRAKLAAYGVSPEDVEVLAHLCGGEVDET